MSTSLGSPSQGYAYSPKNINLLLSTYYNDSLMAMGQAPM